MCFGKTGAGAVAERCGHELEIHDIRETENFGRGKALSVDVHVWILECIIVKAPPCGYRP